MWEMELVEEILYAFHYCLSLHSMDTGLSFGISMEYSRDSSGKYSMVYRSFEHSTFSWSVKTVGRHICSTLEV